MTGDVIRREGLIEWSGLPVGKTCALCGNGPGAGRVKWWKEADKPGSARWVCGACYADLNGSAAEATPATTPPPQAPAPMPAAARGEDPAPATVRSGRGPGEDPAPGRSDPYVETFNALQLLAPAGGVFEVRALGDRTASGYFDADHLEQAAKAIEALDAAGTYSGIYVTLNPVNPALLSRRSNRIETRLPKNAATTADADIARRRWLPVDIDVTRPSGISSSDEEHRIALDAAGRIARYLSEEHGFPEPIRADSGNGAHLLYRIDLPNDEESGALVKRCLQALGAMFDKDPAEGRPGYEVDQTTFNAARIWKLYGTMARKGDHTPERPHRRARILEIPDAIEVVRPEALAALAALAPEEEQPVRQRFNGRGPGIDLDEWLNEHGASLPAYQAKSTPGMRSFYVFDVCPWDPSHRDRSAFVGQRTDGPLVAGCHHNGCSGRTWQDLRDLVEPRRPKIASPCPRQPPAQVQTTEAPDQTRGGPCDAHTGDYTGLYTVSEKGKSRLDFQRIADVLIARYEPVTFNGVVWIYDGGLYRREQGEILSFVSEVARAALFEGSLTTAVREVTAYVAAHDPTPDYPFDDYPNALPLSNGVLIIDWEAETATLHPYAPKYRFTGRWPVAYDPEADPGPIHEEALALYVDDDEVVALYQLPAQAILHYCGYGPFKRSYIFEGPTNGGKTTYLVDFLNAIFGAENISNVSLQRIGTDRFVAGDIENAAVNRCDDLSDVPLENVGPFKALTGGFSHNIERKFKTPYRGRITAVHAFTTNMPPTVPDNILFDPAFWSRWIYLRFNNVFEVDPSFVPRVFTPENVSGAFNRILEVAFEIRRTSRLPYEQDPGEVRETWQSAANPFEKFVSAEMQATQTPTLFDKSRLFRAFLAWCGENEINPRKLPGTIAGFTKMIFSAGFATTRRGPKASREWMYEGRYAWKQGSKYQEMI